MKSLKSNSQWLNWQDKMLIRSASRIYLSAFLSVSATFGGWAITSKFAGDIAALSFLYFSIPIIIGTFILQIALFFKSRDKVRILIMFNISAIFGVLWMMSCLVLPIFWIDSIGNAEKLIICIFSLVIFYANIAEGLKKFRERWAQSGERFLERYYKPDRGVIQWDKIIESLKLSVSIHIPGIPSKMDPILSLLLVASMLAGFTLRKIFPTFSIFAWSIPSLVVIATMLQMIGIIIGQLSILRALEKKDEKVIRLL